jgi:membrane-associated phospholipid phosphatase
MEILADFSLEVTRWLQDTLPQLEGFLAAFTETGTLEFYLVVITLIYWSLEKKLGRLLIFVLVVSYSVNTMFKHFFTDPRPYWKNPEIERAASESYGFPSGHTQGSTLFYGILAWWVGRMWFWIVAVILIIIMALSRVYLGVHDIEDVAGGFLLGCLVLFGLAIWRKFLSVRFSNRILGLRLLIALLVPITLTAIYILGLVVIGDPDYFVPYADRVESAELKSFRDFASSFGMLIGLGVGFLLEMSRVRFKVEGPIWKRLIRYLLGLVVTLLLWMGLGSYIPDEPLGVTIPLRALLGFIGGLWVAYYAPWLFVQLNLADSDPSPEVSISF